MMNILSVNRKTSLETIAWRNGEPVKTGINKQPVEAPVMITEEGLEGDCIADKKHHGGKYKAVYTYAAEHYDYWRKELARPDLPYGAFGENLTTVGLDESTIHIGDRFKVGEAIIEAAEPRQPCWVLGKHLEDKTMVKRLLDTGRLGVYFQVIRPGRVQVGDPIERVDSASEGVPVSEITRLHTKEKEDISALRRILQVAALPPDWRDKFQKQLDTALAKFL